MERFWNVFGTIIEQFWKINQTIMKTLWYECGLIMEQLLTDNEIIKHFNEKIMAQVRCDF